MKKYVSILRILTPLIGGIIIGIIIYPFMNYQELIKPPFSPPSFLFPLAWTILYLLIGLSYQIIKANEKEWNIISIIYYIQLFINFLWPIFFFIFKFHYFSIIWLTFLILVTILLIWLFYQKNKIAAYLLYPYIIWLCYALYLNIGIALQN